MTSVVRSNIEDARAGVKRAKFELEDARAWLAEARERVASRNDDVIRAEADLASKINVLESLMRDAGVTVCDACGDESNSEPNLRCGRVDDDNPPCTGTYRRA